MSSRTSNTIRNMKYAIAGQTAGLLISFLLRMVFVRTLSAEYLGLDGLFTNILSILSFAELGVGSAIVYSMYQPLEEKNKPKLKALMGLYQRAYIIIGIVILITGAAFAPFLNYVIKDMPDIPYISAIYLMFVINSALSYFFSYKRSLIIADQKRYIATIYRYGFYFILNVAQIFILLITHNYILFLGLQLMNTLIENILVSRKANKLYPFLKEKNTEKLDADEKRKIVRNVKAMIFHKTGDIVVSGTDNIIISKFVGVVIVGVYSNYLLIINALNRVFDLGFQALLSSIGNLGVTESEEKQLSIFKCINFAGFWIYGFVSICLFNLMNPFIGLWLGEAYLLSMTVVIAIVTNFYLNGMRRSVLTFRDALGLYWYDRYKPLIESGINLVVSIILAKSLGITGVLLGTIISILTTCFWVEPFVLFKYGFHCSVKHYFVKYGYYTGVMLIAGWVTWWICRVFVGDGWIGFLGKIMVSAAVPNLIFAGAFWRKAEFRELVKVLKK